MSLRARGKMGGAPSQSFGRHLTNRSGPASVPDSREPGSPVFPVPGFALIQTFFAVTYITVPVIPVDGAVVCTTGPVMAMDRIRHSGAGLRS